MSKYRLYIDEVGNSDLDASRDPNHRYLSLTGIILALDYVDSVVAPELEALKRRFFITHVDEPLILHRKEIVNKRYPFHALRNPEIEARFNADLLDLLKRLDYTVVTVVLDKLEHKERYTVWQHDPYHYSLEVLLERYVLWLRQDKRQGDAMAESRGGKEDTRLKRSFERLCKEGTSYVGATIFAEHLTSCQLKVKAKSNNIAGLQLADLIAHPSFKATLARHHNQGLAPNFGGQIATILEESKYLRNPLSGRIEGWGREWLP